MRMIRRCLTVCFMFVIVMLWGTVSKAAQIVEVNTPVQVSIDENAYQFTIEKQGKVTINVSDIESVSYDKYYYETFTLYETDEDENELKIISGSANRSGNIITTPVRLKAGTYIVKWVSYFKKNTANMIIQYEEENPNKYETEKNNSWSTANVIELNKEYTANIQTADDVDTYKFDLEQEGSLYLNLRNIETDAKRWKVALYVKDNDDNHNLIASWANTTNKNSKFTRYRLPKGSYYIQVSKDDTLKTIDYSIGTTYVAETIDDSEIEYNNTVDTANQILPNTEYKANIATTNDVDYYTFTLEKKSKVILQVRQESDEITKGLYKVTLYKKNQDDKLVLYDRFDTISNKVSKGNEVLVPEGTYIVYVKNNSGAAESFNDYILKVIQEETQEEIPDMDTPQDVEGQNGIPIAVNSIVQISLEEGRYLFNIPKEGKVTINVSDIESVSYDKYYYETFTLYETDEDENELKIISGSANRSGNIITTPVRLKAGTYIVKWVSYFKKNTANMIIKYDELPDLSEAVIEPIKEATYTGEAIVPKLKVTYKNKILEEKKDYTVSCSNNVSVGTAIVNINAVDDASVGTQKTTFNITKRTIPVPVTKQSEFIYDGTQKQLLVDSSEAKYISSDNDKKVNAGVYTAKYSIDSNNCVWDNGKADAVTIPWTIKKANATVTVGTVSYTQTFGDPAFSITDVSSNSDGNVVYKVSQGEDVVTVNSAGQVTSLKAGTAIITVMVPATTNFNESEAKTINILINEKVEQTTDGNNSGNNSSSNNNEVNNADAQAVSQVVNMKAKISKLSNKKGKKITFKLSGLGDCDGYQIQYSMKSSFKASKTINKNSNSITIKKLKKGKKYYIHARVYKKIAGETYYGKWSAKKSIKVKK